MSRCFPFPPPGYEKKDPANDVDLLKKVKHREKKHKKEKKDKEKKESKDKRKREKNDGNGREKKDKKEKRGDQAKDKEKNDDKYESVMVEDEKKLDWKHVVHTGKILGQNGFSNEGKAPGKVFENGADERSSNNHRPVKVTEHSESMQDLGRRIGDGNRDRGSVRNLIGMEKRKEEEMVARTVTKDFGNDPEAKDKNRDRTDGPGNKVMPESNGHAIHANFPGFYQSKFEGKTEQIEKRIGRKAKGKTKTKKEKDDKHGGKDREKKNKGEVKKSEKEKKKEMKCDDKTAEQDKIKGEEMGYMGIYGDNMPVVKDGDMASGIQGHLIKLKDLGGNGVFLGSGQVPEEQDGGVKPHLHPVANINPSELPYPPHSVLSSHSLVQNGNVLDACETPLSSTPTLVNLVVDEKKPKVIGIIEGQAKLSSSSKPVPTTSKPKKITPHPDAKYLEEVLSVPKMEEFSEFDDQEWLLCGDETSLKKPRIDNSCINELPHVWDKGVLIDSADIYALPYVIPY